MNQGKFWMTPLNLSIENTYNLGLEYLLSGSPEMAFNCFSYILPLCSKNPLIWVRLAESCLALHIQKVISLINSFYSFSIFQIFFFFFFSFLENFFFKVD